jgi:hypothetical protein
MIFEAFDVFLSPCPFSSHDHMHIELRLCTIALDIVISLRFCRRKRVVTALGDPIDHRISISIPFQSYTYMYINPFDPQGR